MEKIELEVYSQAINQGIVRMPHRQFPGLVIQRDTLSCLVNLAKSIFERAKRSSDNDLIDEADELKDRLNGFLLHYENVLEEHDIELPY